MKLELTKSSNRILVNISVTVLPTELEVMFYKYGLIFPVYHMSQVVRTIIFNTKDHLGYNFGILTSWFLLSVITLPTFQYLMRNREIAAEEKSLKQPQEKSSGDVPPQRWSRRWRSIIKPLEGIFRSLEAHIQTIRRRIQPLEARIQTVFRRRQ